MKSILRLLPLGFGIVYVAVAVYAGLDLADTLRGPAASGDFALATLDALLILCAAALALVELGLALFARPRKLRWHLKTWLFGVPAVVALVGIT